MITLKQTIYESETEWSKDCPICGRTVYATERSDGIIEIETCGCPDFEEFDWFEGTWKFKERE